LKEALARSPDAEVYEHLGHVYLMRGDKARAQGAWRDGLALGSRDPEVIERIKQQLNRLQNRKD
jgi:Flp pilus assembly protein TadD